MKRKTLFLLSILTLSATLLFGCKSAESVEYSENTETAIIESEVTEEIETITETETEFILETETNKDGTPEATNSEGLTVDEATKADYDYMDSLVANYEGDLFTKYDAYVKDQGADAYNGAWLIYYYGSAAGDQRSYAINQRTGEKMVAGPDSYFYGTSLNDDGAEPFWGTDKTYPGDTFPEFEENMTLAIEGKPAHTNGQ